MSIVTLKKKSNATYKKLSGKSNGQTFIISNRGPGDTQANVVTGNGGGFSINGNVRSRSYIGKTYQMSCRPKTSSYCCTDNSHTVKPSVCSNTQILNRRKIWKKTPFTSADFPEGFETPTHGKLQHIYNNWVQTGPGGRGVLGSSSSNVNNGYDTYLQNLRDKASKCNTTGTNGSGSNAPNTIGGTSNTTDYTYECNNSAACGGSRIGGKYNYLSKRPGYVKQNNNDRYDYGMYNSIARQNRSNTQTGYDKPFPYTVGKAECATNYTQANNRYVLQSYYAAQNNTPGFC